MPRSRSRTPPLKRDRRRSRSRSRERRHRKKRSRSRSPRYRSPAPRHKTRSISPRRRSPVRSPPPHRRSRERSREREKETNRGDKKVNLSDSEDIDESKMDGMDEEQMAMMKLMGFATFDSTKGKKVQGNELSAVNLQRKRRYRQYMNRRGGFNRPLDFVA